jgi:predicted DNA-binding transcriptional regulator YafY
VRRADRLFQIVQLLRSRRLTTARWLAERLEISERTVYRDVRDLMLSGVPIEGEAGVGYTLRHKLDLPPLMFDRDELDALKLGARMVAVWGDPALAKAAETALAKVRNVLPDNLRQSSSHVYVPMLHDYPLAYMGPMRAAIDGHKVVQIGYETPDGSTTERRIWPLGLFFWGNKWTLVAWCELRNDHRHFRLDRIHALDVMDEHFTPSREQSLAQFLRDIGASTANLD